MKIKKITKRWAVRRDACETSVKRFFRLFPDGLDLKDEKQVKRAWRVMSLGELVWFLADGNQVPCTCGSGPCIYGIEDKRQLRPYAKEAGLPI